ncbi:conserved Plasmodium protein, unknown function [Plasmodium reichenowi]|uniref:Uncharacterized protein n=1 Tax=Plasmodium reichenowi TaxID=5854 RepID=A0A2P9DLV9_PLARE|nr:conserved Plasmodium protein, unknown function [Plasmodium reichenowi]
MNTKKEDYNNDKLYFKLYEYISRIDKFPSNDINLQNEKKKRKYINKQKKKDEYKNLNHETVSNFNKNVINAKGTDDNTFKEKNEHIIIRNDNINYDNQNTYGYNQDCDEYKDYLSNDSLSAYSSFDEEENEIDSYITENEQSEIDQRNKEDRKNNNLPITLSDQKEIKDNHLHKNNITDNILHNLSEEKSSFHISSNNEPTNDFYNNRENKEILEKKEKNNICQYKFKDIEKNNNMDIFMEIENYYFIYKMNRKIEEYNSVNEMKIIKSERNEKLSEMFKKIHSILTHYKEIKIELKNLIKNKQLIYKNFYSIFLHYYYRYSEVKMIKLNKSKIEKRLKYYTNIERFEMILDKMEKNVYAYFIDIYKTSMIKNRQVGKNQECAVSHEEEEEYTSDNEETDEDLIDEMDEDGDYDEAYDNINDNINNNGDDNIYDNINNNMDDDIYDNIYDNIYDSMYDNIYDSMYDDVDDNIYDNIANNTDNNNDNIMPGNINKHINNIIDNHINDHSKEETHDDISQETQQKIDLSLTNEKKKKTSKISDTNKKNVTKTKNQTKDKKKNSFFCINKSTLENNEYACSSHPLNERFLKNMECNFLNNIDDDNFKREIYKKLLNKNKIDKNNEKRKKKRHINNKLNEKNEIHSMLHFSEKAIKFFKKNNTYFNAKGKILKYQSIIKRILKYIINLFRDVLNNTDLNINMTKEDRGQYLYDMQYENRRTDEINDTINRNSLKSQNKNINNNDIMSCDEYINRNWGKSPISNNEIKLFCYTQNENYSINQTGNKKENALFEENIENEEKMTENFITYEDIKKSNIYENNINDNNIYKISTINNLIKNHFLLQTNDEKEIDKIYNNVNIIYFNKYIDEFEYYKKYKIKCYCMKDIINFIYKKSLNDENNLYIDDYNSLESIYVSTRLKILNNNILKNFEYFFDKDICKYIKNVCLLAIYISKLESDLFLHIFNNNLNSSINIILNSIGVCIYDNINEKIYELNNMKIIRKIIQIIYVDIIDIYTDDSYNIIHDYLKRICTTLKERLLYIIEMYISYYTKNVNYNSTIPYMCFQSIKKKFTNIINGFLYEDYIVSSNYEIINHETKKNKDKRLNDPQDNFHDQNIHSDHMNHIEKKIDNISSGNIYNSNDKYMEISENDDYSSESIESENNYKEHEYNINILNENNVYKSFSFNNIQFNKDTIFSLRGIDMNIIGTILILKTINFIIEENTFIDLFKECLENTFNSITHVYKQYIKKHDDMFNSNIFLIKNLSFLLYLFYKVTNDNEFLNTYLHKDLIDHLLFNVTHKESKKNDQKYKTGKDNNNNNNEITRVENEISIFNFIKRVYTVSSNTDVQNKILNMFNESLYNFIITTISKVCAPLINILSNEYNDYENENDIKEVLYNWINGKKKEKEKEEEHNKDNSRKDLFSFLKDLDFEQLKEYTKNINEKKNQELSNKNMDDIKNELQSFRQKIYFLFPKIYFYIKLFICSNTDRYSENNFFYVLFDYIIGVLKYKIIYMLSEVYFLLGCKYSKKISNIFEENYINDIFLFLNSNEQYSCVFSDIHQYYDMKKNYNFL